MNNFNNKISNKLSGGFTLIELLVVIAIIGILASVVLASLSDSRSAARDARRLAEAKQLQTALELYRNNNNNSYPCYGTNANQIGNCANAAPASAVNLNHPTNRNTFFLSALNFEPTTETPTTMQYRLRSTAGNSTASPDRTSYTIIVALERTGTWCRIDRGTGHSGWSTYNPCF